MQVTLNEKLCSGCKTCEIICALSNFKEINPKKSALRIYGKFPSPGEYKVSFCIQCGRCAEVCLTKAIYNSSASENYNVYLLDPEKCTNCKACTKICPQNLLFTHIDIPYPIKCNWCMECVNYCSRNVINIK